VFNDRPLMAVAIEIMATSAVSSVAKVIFGAGRSLNEPPGMNVAS